MFIEKNLAIIIHRNQISKKGFKKKIEFINLLSSVGNSEMKKKEKSIIAQRNVRHKLIETIATFHSTLSLFNN